MCFVSSLVTVVMFLLVVMVGLVMVKFFWNGKVEIFSFIKGVNVEINGKVLGTILLSGLLVLKFGVYMVRVYKCGFIEFLEDI